MQLSARARVRTVSRFGTGLLSGIPDSRPQDGWDICGNVLSIVDALQPLADLKFGFEISGI
eukprot:2727881-Prorocentrum_lima.AAC.1